MTGQAPSLCRMVLTPVDPATNNGSHLAPAVVTRVFPSGSVNLRVLTDSTRSPDWKQSCVEVEELPESWDMHANNNVWAWPPRT
jgi:hypothetical protein